MLFIKLLAPAEFMDNDLFDPMLNQTIHKTGVCSTVPYSGTTAIQVISVYSVQQIFFGVYESFFYTYIHYKPLKKQFMSSLLLRGQCQNFPT